MFICYVMFFRRCVLLCVLAVNPLYQIVVMMVILLNTHAIDCFWMDFQHSHSHSHSTTFCYTWANSVIMCVMLGYHVAHMRMRMLTYSYKHTQTFHISVCIQICRWVRTRTHVCASVSQYWIFSFVHFDRRETPSQVAKIIRPCRL